MRTIFFLFILFLGLLAEDTNTTHPKLLYPSFVHIPQDSFVGEIITIEAKLLVADDTYDHLLAEQKDYYGVKPLTPLAQWEPTDTHQYRLQLLFKVTEPQYKLPDIATTLSALGEVTDIAWLEGEKLQAKTPDPNERYCGVVAHQIQVRTHKVDRFDETHNILAMELAGTMANIEDFHIPFLEKQGIDWVKGEPPVTTIFYYAIIPSDWTKLEYHYFDPVKKTYQRQTVMFDLSTLTQKSSTQVDINPTKRGFPFLRFILLLSLLVLLFFLYYKTRNLSFLFLIIALLVAALFLFLKEESVVLRTGAKVYLLPTKNATLFYTATYPQEVQQLGRVDGYYKIILPDQTVGWVKEEAVLDR